MAYEDLASVYESVKVGQVISELNYNASFGFNKDELQNWAKQNDNAACGKYFSNISDHVLRVMKVWFEDTGIEDKAVWKRPGHDHSTPMPLRTIAEKEFGVDKKLLYDIDDIIRLHDRSRFSEDEFYAAANHFFGTNNQSQFNIAQLKHFQRNAHEFGHYVYRDEQSNTVISEMPEAFIWQRIAVWLANYNDTDYVYNTNSGIFPFQYYWGHGYNSEYYYYYVQGMGPYGPVSFGPPTMPNRAPMGSAAQARFKEIIYRWEQPEPIFYY